MRVAALSDIHGNLPALEAVLDDVEREGVDAIVVAGDTISGPWPVEAFDAIVGRNAAVVRGNADREVYERSTRHGPLAEWCAERLGDERLAVAASWPLALELELGGLGHTLVCHSTPRSDEPIYTRITPGDEVAALFESTRIDVALVGHTHMQFDRRLSNGLRVVNPGSVGMPYEGRRGAFWALLGPDVEFRMSEYDVDEAVRAIRELGVPVPEELLTYLVSPLDSETATAEFESLRGA